MQETKLNDQRVHAALEEILVSPLFKKSARQSKFLRYVVEFYLNSPNGRLSSFDIATDCFHRPQSGDPNDAYVRNIASQTRRSLNVYYGELSRKPALVIQLAEKGYLVRFTSAFKAMDESPSCRITAVENHIPTQPVTQPANKRLPTIAIIPFRALTGNEYHSVIGELVADSLITSFFKSDYIRVISRRTSAQFSGSKKALTTQEMGSRLNADYIVEGDYLIQGDSIRLQIELCRCDNDEVIWSEQLRSSVQATIDGTDEMIRHKLFGIAKHLRQHVFHRGLTAPLSSLECYSFQV